MDKKKTPPANGESGGPIMEACQWYRSSPTGPAEQYVGGSFSKSFNSFVSLFRDIDSVCLNKWFLRCLYVFISYSLTVYNEKRKKFATCMIGSVV